MGACVRIPVVAVVASPAPYQNLALPPVRHLADSQTRPLPASVSGKLLSSPSPNNRLCPTPQGCQSHQERPLHRVSPSGLPAELGDDKAPTCASVCGFQPRTSLHPWKLRILTRPLLRLCLWDPTRVLQACLDPSSTKKALRYGLCGLRRLHRSVRCNRAAFPQLPHVESLLGRRHCPGLGSCVTFAEPRWRHSRLTRPSTLSTFFK
jgi:hypothetical protein